MENGQTGQTGKSETQNERIKDALKLRRGHPQFGRQTGPIRLDSLLVIPREGNAKLDGSAKVVQETPFAYLTTPSTLISSLPTAIHGNPFFWLLN